MPQYTRSTAPDAPQSDGTVQRVITTTITYTAAEYSALLATAQAQVAAMQPVASQSASSVSKISLQTAQTS